MQDIIQQVLIQAIPLVFAITIHEVAHGWVASKLGDPTAKMMGRITLNPVAHVDPVGTVILPLFLIVSGVGMVFGWAKPVPVNFSNLRRVKRDSILVAFAGPGSKFVQLMFWAGVIWLVANTVGVPPGLEISESDPASRFTAPLVLMGVAGLQWNFWLGLLNLFPILPLDGGRIMNALLPVNLAAVYGKLETVGFFLLVFLLYFFGEYLAFLFTPLKYLLGFLLG